MKKIIYYVASSLDGFIAGLDDDISMFVAGGKVVERYRADLLAFRTVIMGRRTYEFGYRFGLEAGQPAYPHMRHFIFSHTLEFERAHPQVHVKRPDIEEIVEIRQSADTDIYLCGGGRFAGWLLDHDQVDQLKLKLNPILLGQGVPLFGTSQAAKRLELVQSESFDDGLELLTYEVRR